MCRAAATADRIFIRSCRGAPVKLRVGGELTLGSPEVSGKREIGAQGRAEGQGSNASLDGLALAFRRFMRLPVGQKLAGGPNIGPFDMLIG